MLHRGDQVPHFEASTAEGVRFSYSTIWQRRNLLLITLPALESASSANYVSELTTRLPEFGDLDAECIVTRDAVPGLPGPGVLIADRWGEIVHLVVTADVVGLPPPQELLDWMRYVQTRCPECEGEAR
jgi:hypothetical protein